MKQLFYRHVHRDNCRCCGGRGITEVIVGPYTEKAARTQLLVHRGMDTRLSLKSCHVTVQPYAWKYDDWGGLLEQVEVCTPGCAGCRSGEHNEVRDAA